MVKEHDLTLSQEEKQVLPLNVRFSHWAEMNPKQKHKKQFIKKKKKNVED